MTSVTVILRSSLNRIRCTFFMAALMITTVFGEECNQDEIVKCTQSLELISSPVDMAFVNKPEHLDAYCPDLHKGLHCIRAYTRRCMNLQQRNHFNQLYRGTSQVIRDLCRAGDFQNEYLRHAPCLGRVQPEQKICSNDYQTTLLSVGQQPWPETAVTSDTDAVNDTEMVTDSGDHHRRQHREHDHEQHLADEKSKMVCCSFRDYLDCTERAVNKVCGLEAAMFTRAFQDHMANLLITTYCEKFIAAGKCYSDELMASDAVSASPNRSFRIIVGVIATLAVGQFN